MFNKITTLAKNPSEKAKFGMAVGTVITAMAAFAPMALAAGNNTVDMNGLIGQLLGIICDIFLAIGILLAAWSIGMLVLAFKNEDADSKSRAMMMLVVSVALIGAETLIKLVLDAAKVDFTIGSGIF